MCVTVPLSIPTVGKVTIVTNVNHRYNFVDPASDVHTQHIERLWGSARWRNKVQRGTARSFLQFMWRNGLAGSDPFEAILKAKGEFWPPGN